MILNDSCKAHVSMSTIHIIRTSYDIIYEYKSMYMKH